jgi:phosphoribosyl-ATP pyrophosphohydrolase/phosphoribosyl-AMP cyclohydrolase
VEKSESLSPEALAFGHGTAPADGPALIPAIVQDRETGEVLMLAWQSREAVAATLATGDATFWSRSRKGLWKKGETSGNVQKIRDIRVDCDADAVLLQVDPAGPACHTGERTCFYRHMDGAPEAPSSAGALAPLLDLERTLEERKHHPPAGSYVAKLYGDTAKRHKKVGEEATELVVASLGGERKTIVSEAADLLFHTLVLLRSHDIALSEIAAELEQRFGAPRRE